MTQRVDVSLEPGALADFLLAVALCDVEISGLAIVAKEGSSYRITDSILVFSQECSMGSTDFDENAYGHWQYKMMEAGHGNKINEYRLWWHSHVWMSSFFSSTDKKNIADFKNSEWWLSWVGNKLGQTSLRLDVFKPEHLAPLYIQELNLCGLSESVRDIRGVKEHMRELMISREAAMKQRVEDSVVVLSDTKPRALERLRKIDKIRRGMFPETLPFERILDGVFGR